MFGLFIFGGYSLASATSSETRMAGAVPLIVAVPAISAVSASRPSTSAPSWAPERPAAEQLRVIVGHLLAQTAPPNGSRSHPSTLRGGRTGAVEPPRDVRSVDYSDETRLKVVSR